MDEVLWGSTREQTAALRAASRASAVAFVAEQRAIAALYRASASEHREFVSGEVGCVLHLSPHTGSARLETGAARHGVPASGRGARGR